MARKGAVQTSMFAGISNSGFMGAAVWCVCGIAVCLSSAKVIQRRQWRWRHFAEFLFDLGLSVV